MISLKTKEWQIDNIETIIFDKDGTLIDLHYFWGKMTRMRSKKIVEFLGADKKYIDVFCKFLGFDVASNKMLPDGITALYSRDKIIEIFCSNLKSINFSIDKKEIEKIFDKVSEMFYSDISKYTVVLDGVYEFLEKIKNNVSLAIVTSDSIISTKLTIKQFGFDEYFTSVIGRESCIYNKESGKPTLIALEELNANPKTTIMIGDAPMDLISAKNAGINKTILVASGQISKNELSKISNYTCFNLKDIEVIL